MAEEKALRTASPEAEEALEKLYKIALNLEEAGILDTLVAITEPETLNRLVSILMTPGTMRLVDSLDMLLNMLGEIVMVLKEEPEPAGVRKLLSSLRDPQVARGLGRLIAILKILGK
ncbi:helical membrane plugin domain-containing protein [Stetteria hydrogenophila]